MEKVTESSNIQAQNISDRKVDVGEENAGMTKLKRCL